MSQLINPGDHVFTVLKDTYVFARAVGIDEDGYMVIRFDAEGEPRTMRYKVEHLGLVSSLPKTFYDGMDKKRHNNRLISFCDVDGTLIKEGYVVGEVSDHRTSGGRMGIVRRFDKEGDLVDVAWNTFRSGFSPCNKLIVISTNENQPLDKSAVIPTPLSIGDSPVMTPRSETFLRAVEHIDQYLNFEGASEGRWWWVYVVKRLYAFANQSAKPMDTVLYHRYKDAAKTFTKEERKKAGGRMKHFSVLNDSHAPRIKDRS